MKAKNIPNILSGIRLLMVPVFVYVFFFVDVIPAIGIFLMAGLTDMVDGFLARRFGWITNLGKILDPIADKSMQCVVLICMSIGRDGGPLIPWWLTAFFVLKELLMAVGAIFIFKKKDTVVSSRWFGKLAVCIFYATVFCILAFDLSDWAVITLSAVTVTAALIALISYAGDYFRRGSSQTESAPLSDNASDN